MSLDHARPKRNGGHARRNTGFMTGISNRYVVTLTKRRDRPEVQFRELGRIGAATMQENEIVLPEHLHGMVDLVERAHSCRKHDRLALRAGVAQEFVVR